MVNKLIPETYTKKIKKTLGADVHLQKFIPNAGYNTDAILVNDDQIVLFSKDGQKGSFHKTIEISDCIRDRISLPLPRATIIESDFAVLKKIKGQPLTREKLNNLDISAKKRIATQLGQFIVELQSIDVKEIAHLQLQDNSARYSKALIEKNFEEMLKVVSPHVKMGSVNASLGGHFNSWFGSKDHKDCKPVLCHGELAPVHIFHENLNINGILDFGEASIGDPGNDLMFLIWTYGESFVQLLVESQPGLAYNFKRARFLFGFMLVDWIKRGLVKNEPRWFAQFLSLPLDFNWLR
jgi:aminoglycoside 2''-phosphotransferase